MTALGKILVFVNLAFSLITAGFITMAFIARTNWKVGFDNLEKQLTVARADLSTERQSKEIALQQRAAELKLGDQKLAGVQAQLEAVRTQLAAEQTQRAAAERERDSAKAINESTKDENRRLVVEQQNLQGQLVRRDNEIVGLKRDVLRYRDDAVKFQLAYDSARQRAEALLAQLTDVGRQLRTLQASGAMAGGAGGRPSVLGGASIPPAEDVRGRVLEVDVRNGLARVSVGSDHGVVRGTVLEIFRLDPDPNKSLYLGTLEITDSRAKEAVGRYRLVPGRYLQVNDEVASRLSTSQ